MLIKRNWREHLPWIGFIAAISAAAVYWYVAILTGTSWERRPAGSSFALLLFGIAGGGICLFEFLLWPRKHWRVLRLGPTKLWMRAHIWLGLLAVPLLILHSGFYFRNVEANLLILLFLVVIASGVYGLYVQQVIPRQLLDEVPAETIYSQIPHISNLLLEEGNRLVMATCGVAVAGEDKPPQEVIEAREEEALLADAAANTHYVVGAVRTVGNIQGKVLESRSAVAPVPNSEKLREFFNDVAAAYLKDGSKSGSQLAEEGQARVLFNDLRLALDTPAHNAVSALENLCDQRRQFDLQAKLHRRLHNWLWVHLPLSLALIVLMFVHIFQTMRYLWPTR